MPQYTPSIDPEKALLAILKIAPLKPPGPDSNWHDWDWVVSRGIHAGDLGHVLIDLDPGDRPPFWEADNIRVCGILGNIVDPVNLRYIRSAGSNAFLAWRNLRLAHEDETAGGRIYWLRRLMSLKMKSGDIDEHLEAMNDIYERLDSLVTPERPITPNEFYATALLLSLPQDYTSAVTPSMKRTPVTASTIITALRNGPALRESYLPEPTPDGSDSKASVIPPVEKSNKHCTFCKLDGHTLEECSSAAAILKNHRHSNSQSTHLKDQVNHDDHKIVETLWGSAFGPFCILADLLEFCEIARKLSEDGDEAVGITTYAEYIIFQSRFRSMFDYLCADIHDGDQSDIMSKKYFKAFSSEIQKQAKLILCVRGHISIHKSGAVVMPAVSVMEGVFKEVMEQEAVCASWVLKEDDEQKRDSMKTAALLNCFQTKRQRREAAFVSATNNIKLAELKETTMRELEMLKKNS